ncbi:unnamed protein product, partial [Closterium sp. NIES-65]
TMLWGTAMVSTYEYLSTWLLSTFTPLPDVYTSSQTNLCQHHALGHCYGLYPRIPEHVSPFATPSTQFFCPSSPNPPPCTLPIRDTFLHAVNAPVDV